MKLSDIKSHLETHLAIEGIEVHDDSHLHVHHNNYQNEKGYLRIHLPKQDINRLILHRRIMALAREACTIPIHAIEIRQY